MQELWVHEQQTPTDICRWGIFVVGALLEAQLILDTNVTLHSYEGKCQSCHPRKPMCDTPSTTQH